MLKGALKSKTVWFNVLLAVLGGLELIGAHLTTLFGAQVAAAIMLTGAVANLALRAITTQSLQEKSGG
ncbi:MAG: hypothetical protein FJ167_14625 [Gammaproteobacteria bacterium]|nr:hypothetical protein [Gammaproteobacteria bacterium]